MIIAKHISFQATDPVSRSISSENTWNKPWMGLDRDIIREAIMKLSFDRSPKMPLVVWDSKPSYTWNGPSRWRWRLQVSYIHMSACSFSVFYFFLLCWLTYPGVSLIGNFDDGAEIWSRNWLLKTLTSIVNADALRWWSIISRSRWPLWTALHTQGYLI